MLSEQTLTELGWTKTIPRGNCATIWWEHPVYGTIFKHPTVHDLYLHIGKHERQKEQFKIQDGIKSLLGID